MPQDWRQELDAHAKTALNRTEIPFGVFVYTPYGKIDISLDVLRGKCTGTTSTNQANFSIDLAHRDTWEYLFRPNHWVCISEMYDPVYDTLAHNDAKKYKRWTFAGLISGTSVNIDRHEKYFNIQGAGWYKAIENSQLWQDPAAAPGDIQIPILANSDVYGDVRYLIASMIYGWLGHAGSPAAIDVPKEVLFADARNGGYIVNDLTGGSRMNMSPGDLFPDSTHFFRNILWDYAQPASLAFPNPAAWVAGSSFEPRSTLLAALKNLTIPALHELYFDVAPDPKIPMHTGRLSVHFRQKPFSQEDWENLETHTIYDQDITRKEIGYSDQDVVNYVALTYSDAGAFNNSILATVSNLNAEDPVTGGIQKFPLRDQGSMNRNGVRPLVQQIPFEIGTQSEDIDILRSTPLTGDALWNALENIRTKVETAIAEKKALPDNRSKKKKKEYPKVSAEEIIQTLSRGGMTSRQIGEQGNYSVLLAIAANLFSWNRFNDLFRSGTINVPYQYQRHGRRLVVKSVDNPTIHEEYYIQSRTIVWGRELPTMCNLGVVRGISDEFVDRFGDLEALLLAQAVKARSAEFSTPKRAGGRD